MSTTSNENNDKQYESLYIDYLQANSAYFIEELRARKFKEALEKIAEEQKIYKGHGDYDIEPALTAQGAQDLARKVLSDNQ